MTTSVEERAYRRSSKKRIKGESKTRLLETLIKKNTGLSSTEEFVKKELLQDKGGNTKGNTTKGNIVDYQESRKLVGNITRSKLRGNIKNCIVLRREKIAAEENLILKLGGKTRTYKRIVKETRKHNEEVKKKLSLKNEKKVQWLTKKYGMKYDITEDMDEHEREYYGEAEIFSMECSMTAETLKEPEVVIGAGETIDVTEDEKKILALGPKFCVRNSLDRTEFEVELEEVSLKSSRM